MGKYANLIKRALVASTMIVPLALGSCRKENNPPEASLDLSSYSGKTPLEVAISAVGRDLDGDKDITDYNLVISKKTISSTQTDTAINSSSPIPSFKRIFKVPGVYEVTFTVTDSHSTIDSKSATVNVSQGPFIDQSVSLVNFVDVKYSAVLFDVSRATLTVKKDGVVFLSQDVSDVVSSGDDYSRTFNYALDKFTKGSYDFVLKSDNFEKKSNIVIPDYPPVINISTLNTRFWESHHLSLNLPPPFDKNPEDVNNVYVYTAARSLDTKTQASLSGFTLVLTSFESLGAYEVELEFGRVGDVSSKAVLKGEILKDPRIKVYAYKVPNDSTLNWYGSGDVDKNNVVNTADASRLLLIINGTFSDPGDTRLMDRSDVNGDGVVDAKDIELLSKKLNGTILYLPGYWNQLLTRSEGEDWLKKMLAIDKTNEGTFPGGACREVANQLMINFHGFSDKDLVEFKKKYNYDITNNGRFNIPMYFVFIGDYDSQGNAAGAHAMNNVCFGDDAFIWSNNCIIEPQYDDINQQPGQRYFIGINSLLDVRGRPIFTNNIDMSPYYAYEIKNKVPTRTTFESAVVKFINTRTK